MIDKAQQDIEQRVRLAGNNMFELLLFRLGSAPGSDQRELYGINVFKVREIVEMPPITALAGSRPEVMGVVDIRGQVMPVIDLAQTIGCRTAGGPRILLVTEFARTTQGFAVEEVDDIVRLEWNHVIPADASLGNGAVTGFARLDGNTPDSRLAQVIDVEQILRDVMPDHGAQPEQETGRITLRPGSKVLAADDSGLARKLIEQSSMKWACPTSRPRAAARRGSSCRAPCSVRAIRAAAFPTRSRSCSRTSKCPRWTASRSRA